MALEFGLGRYDRHDPKKSEAWTARWNTLDKNDKEFAYNHLSFYLLFTDIGMVTEKSIPHIVARLRIHSPDILTDIEKCLGDTDLKVYLRKFIGFSANVNTTTSTEFIKRMTEKTKHQLPRLTEKEATEISKIPDVFSLI